MKPHQRFAVEDASQVGEVRRAAQMLALQSGMDETAAGRVAIVATELGTNLVRHARGGALLLGSPRPGTLALLSIDHGPGMDVHRCLQDGFSTGGTAGTGLGAVRRIADRFSAYSLPEHGTVIATELHMPAPRVYGAVTPAIEVSVVALPSPGEIVSGDGWAQRESGSQLLLLMADGLGHGPDAAAAADTAIASFERSAFAAPAALLEEAHERMRATRGAAAALVALDVASARLTFAGAGNICGRLISGVSDRNLMSQHGTLGVQIRRLQDAVYEWPEHAILVLHSDGIVTRWNLEAVPGLLQCDPAVIAGWIIRDHCRGRDDATVLVARRSRAS